MSVELLIANLLRVANEVTSECKHAGIKHDLAELVDLLPDANPLKPSLRKIEHLSQYATAYRYPVSSSSTKRIPRPPSPDELENAIANTRAALDESATIFKVLLDQPSAPAGFAGPPRTV